MTGVIQKKGKAWPFELNNSVYIGKKCPWATWKTVGGATLIWGWSAYLKVWFKSVALYGGWHLINALPDCIFFKENIDV